MIRGSNIDGIELFVPKEFEEVLPKSPNTEYFPYERYSCLGLKLLISRGDIVFDIGAHYGVLSCLISKLCRSSGRVFAFEANTSVVEKAKELARVNNLSNIEFINKFIGEKSGTRTDFFIVRETQSAASTRSPEILKFHPDAIRTEVDVLAIDDFVQKTGVIPRVCKIDVEGAEYVAIKGMRKLLSSHMVDLVIETHGDEMLKIGGDLDTLLHKLQRFGYVMIDLVTCTIVDKEEFVARHRKALGHILLSKSLKNKRFAKRILSKAAAEIKSIPPNFPQEIQDLIDRSKYQEAYEQIARLLTNFPKDAKLNYYYAFCLHMLKIDPNKALRYYNIALENGFDEYWVKYNRGSLLEQLGNIDGAIKDIKQALELKPGDPGATSLLRSIQSKSKLNA